MKVFDALTVLRAAFSDRLTAKTVAARWRRAHSVDPELSSDIIRLGGILGQSPRRMAQGGEVLEPICPIRMARDAGRRDLANEILALMKIDPNDLTNLMENDDAT